MPLKKITFPPAGLVGVNPPVYYIETTDPLSTITTAGYLSANSENQYGGLFRNGGLCCVSNTTNTVSWLVLSIAASGQITLSEQISEANVTSVALTAPAFLSVTGSPVTSAGTLALAYSGTALPVVNGGTGLTSTTANQLLYSSATSTVAGLATANSSVLVTSSGGVPSLSTTLPSALTIPGPVITLTKVNGTESSNAVTASGNAGVITTSSLSTAGGASYAITWTNTSITATSVVSVTTSGGTNTTQNYKITVVPGSGIATLTIYNLTASTALNGTIFISYSVF